jgi:hypothetical protein
VRLGRTTGRRLCAPPTNAPSTRPTTGRAKGRAMRRRRGRRRSGRRRARPRRRVGRDGSQDHARDRYPCRAAKRLSGGTNGMHDLGRGCTLQRLGRSMWLAGSWPPGCPRSCRDEVTTGCTSTAVGEARTADERADERRRRRGRSRRGHRRRRRRRGHRRACVDRELAIVGYKILHGMDTRRRPGDGAQGVRSVCMTLVERGSGSVWIARRRRLRDRTARTRVRPTRMDKPAPRRRGVSAPGLCGRGQ